nr:immunoglobulin light chain junction region [Macaca mulatta]MOV75191.1 immunoglobulin light chain junction region [Macaca mulatta]MOV75331.1 immunoglobulin light chain junction region [Macaca mulatta]MOV75361.1 immunoglobulin light chain junction region [Macaca mulatta]MOV75766.1 immunoglobulin light chain junction region [Macaca mulatta]
CQQETNWPYTF